MNSESTSTTDMTIEEIADLAASAEDIMRRRIEQMKQARDEQPARLAKARIEADEARGWALIEEPWNTLVSAIPTYDAAGERTGDSLTLPSITAKELMGARMAFDMLDCADDETGDRLEDVRTRYFAELNGDTGVLFLVCMAALDTIASVVVPQLLDDLEQSGSNYDARVMLAQARTNAWNGRVSVLKGIHDEATASGVNIRPIDAYDIGATAFDPDAEGPADGDQ
jgi:hypothetical protein